MLNLPDLTVNSLSGGLLRALNAEEEKCQLAAQPENRMVAEPRPIGQVRQA
jgi:hypothetical protein